MSTAWAWWSIMSRAKPAATELSDGLAGPCTYETSSTVAASSTSPAIASRISARPVSQLLPEAGDGSSSSSS